MPQLVPIRAAATDWCVPTTMHRIVPSDRIVPSIDQQRLACAESHPEPARLHHLARSADLLTPPHRRAGAPEIRLKPSSASHRELLGRVRLA